MATELSAIMKLLHAVVPGLTAEEAADILWLAPQLPHSTPAGQAEVKPEPQEPKKPVILPDPGSHDGLSDAEREAAKLLEKQKAQAASTGNRGVAEAEAPAGVAGLTINAEGEQGRDPLGFRTPTAPALPGRLALARALRPLGLRIADHSRYVLDEEATVRQIAEADLWMPVQRPSERARFEVALVVDGASSMDIWRRTVDDLRNLLEHHNAFYDVRLWRLGVAERQITLQAGLASETRSGQPWPGRLLEPGGRRLVMVISDCVATYWHNGVMARALGSLGRRTPVSILQVLPEGFWPRTALQAAPAVTLRARAPGRFHYTRPRSPLGLPVPPGPPVPVLTLQPGVVEQWARLMAGASESETIAYLLDPRGRGPGASNKRPPSAEEQVVTFLAVASAEARRLATLLAAAQPLNLHVARLVHSAMLRQPNQVHLAEVFLSGLLVRDAQAGPKADPDTVRYEFYPGVAEQLRASVPVADAVHVLRVVSSYLRGRMDEGDDFTAWLRTLTVEDLAPNSPWRPFATVAADILADLGGAYAEVAARLDPAVARQIQGPGSRPGPAAPPSEAPPEEQPGRDEPVEQTVTEQGPQTTPEATLPTSNSYELLLSLRRGSDSTYTLEQQLRTPAAVNQVVVGTMSIDPVALLALATDPLAYGRALGTAVFGSPEQAAYFERARHIAEAANMPLHLLLNIAHDAAELQHLRWEVLASPPDQRRLTARGRVWFARYVKPDAYAPPAARGRHQLEAMVAVSSPDDLSRYGLVPVDDRGEVERVRAFLGDLPTTELRSDRGGVSVAAISAALRVGYGIVYLVCHSGLVDGEPVLWLEDAGGSSRPVSGSELAAAFAALPLGQRPSLMVLASCQSAGAGATESLIAIGYALARAGVPAVMTVENNIPLAALTQFMGAFFAELGDHGSILRAAKVANERLGDREQIIPPALIISHTDPVLWRAELSAEESAAQDGSHKLLPLERVSAIDEPLRKQLADYWITSVEELVSTARSGNEEYGSGRPALAVALGMREEALRPIISAASALLPPDVSFSVPVEQELGSGLVLDDYRDVDATSFAVPVSLPEKVEPLFQLPPPASQGLRNTSVAFALAAAYQVLSKDPTDLSEQFIYWACKSQDRIPGDVGTNPMVALRVLQELGVCSEALWPYKPGLRDNQNPGHGPPPETAVTDAARRRITGFQSLPGKGVAAIKAALAQGKPVLIGLQIWEHWTSSWQGSTLGRLRTPLPGEHPGGGHAMLVVGYRDDESAPGRGYFIARNSWGSDWAIDNPDGPGYCHVPYQLVAQQGLAAIAINGVITPQPPAPESQEAQGRSGEAPSTAAAQPDEGWVSAILARLADDPTTSALEIRPNGVSPEGEPLLRLDLLAVVRLALGGGSRDPIELRNLHKAKLRGADLGPL